MDDEPRSAFDLAMERLRRKDEEAGVVERPLTDAQRTALADARRVHEARVAERRILHEAAVRRSFDPGELQKLQDEFRRDLDRFAREHETRVQRIREQP